MQHVEVAKAYYSAPPEYVGQSVWARWDTKLVRIYNPNMELLDVHPRDSLGSSTPWMNTSTATNAASSNEGSNYLLQRCGLLGGDVARWAQAIYQNRGVEGLRVLQGLLNLAQTYSPKELNRACRAALP